MAHDLATWARGIVGARFYCAYCGFVSSRPVCRAHDDLPALDPNYRAWP